MNFSIIIPVYNEEKRIPKNIDEIFGFFNGIHDHKIEIIFVNDGSVDATSNVLRDYKEKYAFQVVEYIENKGKGYAIREGVRQATGDWIVFFDIDLATPLNEFNQLLETLVAEDEVVIGSRRLEKSEIKKSESRLRTFLGQGFTKISNILVPGISDFTCGFKCFSRRSALAIFGVAKIDRWGFDTELLYIAKLKKFAVRQIPVKWLHDEDSRVRVLKAVIDSSKELCIMKLNQLKGYYK
ncbi:MAG: dolichyl-phosphate beta-glucosyltransferase [bacterium]